MGFPSYAVHVPKPSETPVYEDIRKDAYVDYRRLLDESSVPELRDPFAAVDAKLGRLGSLRADWNGQGSEPPNDTAVAGAKAAVMVLRDMYAPPSKVIAAAEGGIAICFVLAEKYAALQLFNTGEVVSVRVAGSTGNPDVKEIDAADEGNLRRALLELREFVGA